MNQNDFTNRQRWKSYTLYFKKCRTCQSILTCMKHGKHCLTDET